MTDKNSEAKKPVKNQLFTASVTGATFEDFSQNAIIFPVQNVPPVNTPSETTSNIQQPNIQVEQTVTHVEPQEVPLQDTQHYEGQENTPQLSSVFSSFSNILNFGGSPNPNPPPVVEESTGYVNFEQKNEVLDSIPLISTSNSSTDGNFINPLLPPAQVNFNTTTATAPPPPPQGTSGNLYRRSGLKKPAYAQVPGLVSAKHAPTVEPQVISNSPVVQPHILPTPTFQNSFQTTQHPNLLPGNQNSQFPSPANYFQPIPSERLSPASSLSSTGATAGSPYSAISTSVSPTVSVVSSILQPEPPNSLLVEVPNLTPTNLDNSSSFPPKPFFSSGIFPHSTAAPLTPTAAILNPVTSPAAVPLFNPITSKTTTFSSPVMAALPENEIPPSGLSSVPNSSNASYGTHNGIQSPIGTTLSGPQTYRPVYHHWFFKKIIEGRVIWQPFSMIDSLALEEAFMSANMSPETVVATDGGRYDVNILRRERYPVYWTSSPTEVRRCSWFHKGNTEGRFVPYEENIATLLEDEFRTAFETNEWHRVVELPNGDSVVFHGADVLVLFPPAQSPDTWGNTPQTQPKPRVLKRGMDEFDIDEGEPAKVDHLLFIVHGIGSVCDLKFRSVTEVVDEFRSIALQLIQSHYRSPCDQGTVNRVEVLPISWHDSLHSEETGIDKTLKNITLESIPRLRDFTNDTLLDILFYTSPIYCQTIITTVGTELNRIYGLFKQRNPSFHGGVSLGGHSLGSLILFDLLCHQHPEPEKETATVVSGDEDIVMPLKKPHPKDRRLSRRISYMMSEAGTGQPQLHYPHLHFQPSAFFALGSPIGMFITVRGLDKLGSDFALPTCPGFFNIFHPYDPVAYRVESLINPELAKLKPVLIPHHKGRKRMHLELKETMVRVGADLKQKLIDSMKTTWNSFFQMALFGKPDNSPPNLEAEVDRVLEQKLAEEASKHDCSDSSSTEQHTDLYLGILNKRRRIDYVLQEAPFEFINEYIFALTSHVCYWESEDTMLLMLKEIYSTMGIEPDGQVPQPNMTIERPASASPKPVHQHATQAQSPVFGMDPTRPMTSNVNVGPPPTMGFVRKA